MSKKLKFFVMMLTCILLSINQVFGQASVGTTMWAEDFSGYSADDVPKGSTSNSHTGTTVYNSGSVTYSCGGDGSTPKIMDAGSPGTGNNMILYKNNGYFEISGIPTGGATELTLSYAVSGTGTLNISCTSANASISETTITISAGSTFDLKFKNTKSDKNLRLDDLSVVVKTAGSGSTKTLHFPSHKSGHSFLPNLSFLLCQCSSCNFLKCLTVALYFHCILYFILFTIYSIKYARVCTPTRTKNGNSV